MDDIKQQELEMAAARQMMDGKVVKKTRPRRTVDYTSGLGRWANVSLFRNESVIEVLKRMSLVA